MHKMNTRLNPGKNQLQFLIHNLFINFVFKMTAPQQNRAQVDRNAYRVC